MSAAAVLGVHSPTPWIAEIGLDRADMYARIDDLCQAMEAVCASAVDPLEVAAALEFEGMSDRTAHERYGMPTVFALAEEMYWRVPRQPAEPKPVATQCLGIGRSALRGVLYGLPAVCFPAAGSLLSGDAAFTVLIVSMLVSWAASQGLGYLGYRRLGWAGPDQARRLLRAGLAAGVAVVVMALTVTALIVPADAGAILFGIGQGAYMLGACVLMVLDRERLILVVLGPGVLGAALAASASLVPRSDVGGGAAAFLGLDRPPTLQPAAWAALAATPVLALALATAHTRPVAPTGPTGRAADGRLTGGGPEGLGGGKIVVGSEIRGMLPRLAFGFLAPALVLVPVLPGLRTHTGAAAAVALAAVCLSLSMGAAEWCVSSYRHRILRLLRATHRLGGFGWWARLALLQALGQYLAVALVLATTVAVIAVGPTVSRLDRPTLTVLVSFLTLGCAMFVSLLLLAHDCGAATVLACAVALCGEILFHDGGAWVQPLVFGGLFALLGGYAAVVLGRATRHAW